MIIRAIQSWYRKTFLCSQYKHKILVPHTSSAYTVESCYDCGEQVSWKARAKAQIT